MPNREAVSQNYAVSKDSLIQLASADETSLRIVPPAPPIPNTLETEPFDTTTDADDFDDETTEPFDVENVDSEEEEFSPPTQSNPTSAKTGGDFGDFPPLNIPENDFSKIADSEPTQPTPTTFAPSAPLAFNGLRHHSQDTTTTPQNSPFAQSPGVSPYANSAWGGPNTAWGQNPMQQTAYSYNPYAAPYGTVYTNPYGYGPYGYPNAPGAYWGPTGFVANPYAQQYSSYPYGRPPYDSDEDEETKKSESLTSTTRETLSYFNPFKSPKGPNRGVGGPLMMRSWRDRPFYFGLFGGAMFGSELISGLVDQDCGGTGGVIFGWYCDNYWGLEARLHFAGLPGKPTAKGRDAYAAWYKSEHGDTGFVPPASTHNNAISMFDVSIHYYPLGNAKWRPFLKLGLGTVNEKYRDLYGTKRSYNTFSIPWGIGLKYWWNERVALQLELTDNVLFSVEETETQNDVALTFGLTFPLGKIKRKDPVVYWPITPSSGR